ncbi:hypothetical protein KKF64_01795 [Patescibacteria group bacterium]|nr:hypothetical protein [Patescibacteria group bacterium]
MDTKPTIKNFIVVILPAVLVVFVIFFLVMPKVRENRGTSDSDSIYTGQVTNFEECQLAGFPTSGDYLGECTANGKVFKRIVNVIDFESCLLAGNPAMESYPRQCRNDDTTYTEEIKDDSFGILPFDSGVKGKVTLGPTCTFIEDPPDPNCEDQPYVTIVQVIATGSPASSPFATIETDKDGNYVTMLPPGEYALQPIGDLPFPRCETKNIIVEPGAMQEVDLLCDTGIR